jgi:hypothetical protein
MLSVRRRKVRHGAFAPGLKSSQPHEFTEHWALHGRAFAASSAWNRFRKAARVLPAAFRKPEARKLPIQRGLLRITGDTLEGPRESDWFDIVTGPAGDVGVVLLDVGTRHGDPGRIGQPLLAIAARGLSERTPLHAVMLDLVRALFEFPGTELRVTLMRCSVAEARAEITTAGMPPLVCVEPGGNLTVHSLASPPLTSTTTVPPPIEVVPLVWGSTWMAVSDGFTAGSDHPESVKRLARDLELPQNGLALSGQTPDALYDLLASRVLESGRFSRDDATLVLIGADPHARFQSGIHS